MAVCTERFDISRVQIAPDLIANDFGSMLHPRRRAVYHCIYKYIYFFFHIIVYVSVRLGRFTRNCVPTLRMYVRASPPPPTALANGGEVSRGYPRTRPIIRRQPQYTHIYVWVSTR